MLTWVLPYFIGSVGLIKNIVKPSKVSAPQVATNSSLAPPILNIPYEATNSSQIDVHGFGNPNSKVRLYIDNESKQTIDVASDGSFTFENTDLSFGTNNIYATTVDEQNKESLPSKTLKLIYDNSKPSVKISSPEDGKVISGGDKKVVISGETDPGTQIYINGSQVIVDKDGNFSTDIAINEGDNIISIKAVNTATNSTEIQRKVTYNP